MVKKHQIYIQQKKEIIMRIRSLFVVQLAVVLIVLAISRGAYAADGAIEISQSTTITAPGSYVLINDITASGTVLQINAPDVTLDLNGFTISQDGGRRADGIFLGANARNVEIRNGTVRGFGRHGIFALSPAVGLRVINMRSVENGFFGLNIESPNALVQGCTLSDNGSLGASVRSGSLVVDNVITSNGAFGLAGVGAIGYGRNVFFDNNGSGLQVSSQPVEIAPNLCGTNTICP